MIIRTMFAAVAISGLILGNALAQDDDSRRGWGQGWGQGWGMGWMMDGSIMGRGHMRGWGRGMGYGPDAMLDRMDGRLAFIEAELNLRDDQKEQWDKLTGVIRDNAEVHNDMMRSMMEDMHDGDYFDKPLPERLTIMETHMEARLEQIRAMREALDSLYAVLDDEQKKEADAIVLPMMGMGMGMMGR